MSASFSDRELLYGILATQMGLVAREALVAGIRARTAGEAGLLGEILLRQRAFSSKTKQLIDALVEQHLALHDNDTARSLASLSTVGSLGDELKTLGVPAVDAGLEHLTVPPTTVPSSSQPSELAASSESESGRFRVLRMHAKGGIGQVLLAVDDQLSREVALKELQPRYADDLNSRQRFVLEAEVTGGLEHPGVVPVYGAGQYADGRPFYAMRFIRGDSLQDASAEFHRRMGKDPQQAGYELELRKLLRRFIDVCEAMEYAHSRGVLHRDLKPGNIMLGRYGETLVVDWGLAKLAKEEVDAQRVSDEAVLQPASADDSAGTRMGSTIGTPNYMSPEQAAGEIDKLGAASDIYSLGATLYHVLTGQPPFQGEDVGVILAAVQSGSFPKPREINSDVAKSLQAICLQAMALQPADRYESAQALAEDVERHLADEPVTALPDSPLQSVQRWTRRHRGATLAGAAALLLVALVSGAAFFAVRSERDEAEFQRDRAVASEQEAQQNFQDAEAARASAEKQKAIAEEQKEIAGRIAYNSTISEASRLVGTDPMMARALLENDQRCPSERRDFLWHLLRHQTVREADAIALEHNNLFNLSYSPDGDVIALGGMSNLVVLRDANSGELLRELETELEAVNELHFSKDGKTLAVVWWDAEITDERPEEHNTLRVELWDPATGERSLARAHEMDQVSVFSVTDSGFVAEGRQSELDYANADPDYRYRNGVGVAEDGGEYSRWFKCSTYNVQTDEETAIYVRPAEELYVDENIMGFSPWIFTQVDNETGSFLWIYNTQSQQTWFVPHEYPSAEMQYAPLAFDEHRLMLFAVEYLSDPFEHMESILDIENTPFDAGISCFSVDLANSEISEEIKLGKFSTGMFIQARRVEFEATDSQVSKLAMLLDRRPLIQLVDLAEPEAIHLIPAHRGDVVSVAMSPDGKRMASTGLDQQLRFWNVDQLLAERNQVMPTVERPKRLVLSPAEDEVAVLSLGAVEPEPDPNAVPPIPAEGEEPPQPPFCFMERYRISDGELLATHEMPTPPARNLRQNQGFGIFAEITVNIMLGMFSSHPISSQQTNCVFSADGSKIVMGTNDRLLFFDLLEQTSDELWGPHYHNPETREELTAIAVTDDMKYFATLAQNPQRIRVYDFESRELSWELPASSDKAFNLQFVPNSHALAVFSFTKETDTDKLSVGMSTWNLEDKTSQSVILPSLTPDDELIFWHVGDRLVAHRSFARQALVIDVDEAELLTKLDLGRDVPIGLFPDSDLLMVVTEDGGLNFWDILLDQYRATLRVFEGEKVEQVAVSREQKTLVILGKNGSLRFLGVDRLRDDLGDVRSLMQRPPEFPETKIAEADMAEVEVAAEAADPNADQPAGDVDLPTIEILDEMPKLERSPHDPYGQPSPAPENSDDSAAPMPPAPVVDPSA